MEHLLQWIQVGTNLALIGIGYKMIRFVARMELKVDLLWEDYEKRQEELRRFGR